MSLSRLKMGIDVPWVTSWSSEEVLGAAPCPTVNGRLAVWQRESPGEGKPQYSMNHHRRQRASVRGLLCPMCGEPTPQDDRWTLIARRTTAGAVRAKGLGFAVPGDVENKRIVLNAGAISPGHKDCLARSHVLCPHLAADAKAELMPFPAKWYVSILQVPGAPEGPGADAAVPVATFLQICGITEEVRRLGARARSF